MPKFAFQFIAGKYEGGSFVIPDDLDMHIGRATDVEVVLIEDMVSRRHAQLSSHNGRLILRDLGSTNGTFVNGERIDACELELQDRILVGTSMLRVVAAERVAGQTAEVNLKATMVGSLPGTQNAGPRLQGALDEVGLAALLAGYAAAKETGRLDLLLGDDRVTLVLVEGELVHASLASDDLVAPQNALRHALSWQEGTFELHRTERAPQVPQSFAGTSKEVVAEALRQNKVTQERYEQTWRDTPVVRFARPLKAKLRDLTPEELDAIQLVLEWQTIEPILEHAHHDDYALLSHLEALVAKGVLKNGSEAG